MSALQTSWPPGTECVAKYNFQGSTEQDLPFCKGDLLTIIGVTKLTFWSQKPRINSVAVECFCMWFIAKICDKKGKQINGSNSFLIVCVFVRWFHGKITRDQAERLLYPPETGLFLVRESTNYPGDYTLCVSCDGKVEHYRIIYHGGKLSIDEEEYFDNLMQLVEVSV
ncbi:tyrosine- kinase CSK-like protein [Labeo rohita]|uniref:Tyrosine-kinase CSK-like protein n=1 Tax=Labeo rohita TaxID=84645 RepID=A0A498MDE2_LABRO|nr:tyrosine- kinase CSK-like protein [Labeo rohita]RXN16440.1 tyrosine- kinase CSK-like protein [Labeo rohita]